MRVLIACEESQAVCKEFRRLGHEAYSCDVQMCTGGEIQWHIQADALELLKMRWDMIIAFPPCTHLAVSGAKWFEEKRADGRQRAAIEFFCKMLNANCDRIAVENPVNIIGGDYVQKWYPDLAEKYRLPIEPTQIIQPYEFGHEARKATCLWLKGLPKLTPTKIVDAGEIKGGFSVNASAWAARDENGKIIAWNDPRTAIIRSKTFPGVARAMAEQWGGDNRAPAYIQCELF